MGEAFLLKEEAEETETGEVLVVHLEGMMCPHCEARVKKTFEEFEEVDSALVSYQEGTAVLALLGEPKTKEMKAAVEKEGYRVKRMEFAGEKRNTGKKLY